MTVSKRDRQNLEANILNENEILLEIIALYQKGEDVTEHLNNWRGGGTTGEAIAEYLATLEDKPKSKPAKKRAAKKST